MIIMTDPVLRWCRWRNLGSLQVVPLTDVDFATANGHYDCQWSTVHETIYSKFTNTYAIDFSVLRTKYVRAIGNTCRIQSADVIWDALRLYGVLLLAVNLNSAFGKCQQKTDRLLLFGLDFFFIFIFK